jgi:hypothetical protein
MSLGFTPQAMFCHLYEVRLGFALSLGFTSQAIFCHLCEVKLASLRGSTVLDIAPGVYTPGYALSPLRGYIYASERLVCHLL